MFKANKVFLSLLILLCFSLPFALALNGLKINKAAKGSSESYAVNVTKVTTTDVPKTVSALGSLDAEETVTISAPIDARIAQIYFKDGQEVGEGMPIVQLDDSQARADYESAVTALNLSRLKYQRSESVANVGAVSQQDLDALKADVDTQAATVKNKLAAMNQLQIVAPFPGVLDAFQTHAGDFVKAGAAVVTLVSSKELRVNYNLSENLLSELKLGQLVIVTSNTYPNKKFYGTVSFISPTIDPTTRMVSLQALIPNAQGLLLPGMFVYVAHQINVEKNAIVVPEQAVNGDIKGYYVFKIVANKAAQVYIQMGDRINGNVRVVTGLSPGDMVVTAGAQKLQDGSNIEIQNNPIDSGNITTNSAG